eukprot:9771787-Heterocapsa_arctica.AAC.1
MAANAVAMPTTLVHVTGGLLSGGAFCRQPFTARWLLTSKSFRFFGDVGSAASAASVLVPSSRRPPGSPRSIGGRSTEPGRSPGWQGRRSAASRMRRRSGSSPASSGSR